MRESAEIRRRHRALKYDLRKRLLIQHLKQAPCNCVYNYAEPVERSEPLDGGASSGPVRLCMLGAEDRQNWPGNVCDTVENARSCPFYEPRHEREDVLARLAEGMSDPEWIAEQDPELATLHWVLGEPEPQQPWYVRLVDWLSGTQPSERLALPEPESGPESEPEPESESDGQGDMT
jgi:hypothetical protein